MWTTVDLLATVEAYPRLDDKIRSTSLKATILYIFDVDNRIVVLGYSSYSNMALQVAQKIESEAEFQNGFLNHVVMSYHGHLSGVYCLALHPTFDVLLPSGWILSTGSGIFVARSKFSCTVRA
ncbi:hypothetical protein RHGRI_010750 [Rhododendron griersonianum]|uniref:Uncharacterized protein n=1 Tax=Rhododendron griersonianum TaxID=479676 RepID=A0AAV6KJK1_9ERIC|nr:hypothetical protein RHGRI_010750 [Rhododendron griersonianum]